MTYQNATFFFVSGTGNSFRAASWMATRAKSNGARTQIVPVELAAEAHLERGNTQLVGIYHPAHGLMPPWSMIHFLVFKLPRGQGAHGVVVSTRGGIPIGPVVIPGGSGLSLFFPLLILLLKGYNIRGGIGIDMPCNVLNIHWGVTKSSADRVLRTRTRNHQRLEYAIFSNKRFFSMRNLLWELIWCIPFALYPALPLLYLVVSRVFMAKVMFADTTCKQCGACARHCPRGAIEIKNKKPMRLLWSHRCEACMRCMGFCRHKSVQASHSWAVVTAYLTSWISSDWIAQQLASRIPAMSRIPFPLPTWLTEPLNMLITFAALIVLYYLFYHLLKLNPIKTFFSYTTLTKLYRRRYHEPNTRARDMTHIRNL
ncbi:MAG: EFR1 family ferrodoxin [Deltaproteobacteria bacterium]|nr:EFR1 family ferrodoxin [Deltaproteobacteria bacterium]MBN2673140.1 EFR1 family ferrodoxin [Deltaproteobacteria bacterium]